MQQWVGSPRCNRIRDLVSRVRPAEFPCTCSDQNIIVTFYFHPFKVVVVVSLVPIPFSSSCVTMAHLHTILSVLCLFLVRATISISVNLEDPGTHQPLRIAY